MPTSASSSLMVIVRADGDTCRRSAARVKLFSRATHVNARSCLRLTFRIISNSSSFVEVIVLGYIIPINYEDGQVQLRRRREPMALACQTVSYRDPLHRLRSLAFMTLFACREALN